MQSSNAPTKIALPFANTSSARRAIPAASQIGITPGAASLTDGFPPLTRTALSIGGVPPSGLDMNGALYLLSATDQWGQAGGQPTYDGAFSTAIGGYPMGAVLKSDDGLTWWRSTAENNTSNPDTGGAGWVSDTVLLSAAGDGTPVMDGIAARGASTHGARADHVHPTDTSLLPKAGGTMTGALALDAGSVSTAPTAAPGTNTTQIATTAFAAAATAVAAAAAAATYAPINSPALTGVPVAPTAAPGTNTTQIASTAFVGAAIGGIVSVPTGAVIPFAMSTAPAGWLACDGTVKVRATYAALFTAISTTYNTGGEAGTDFRLPDLRGEFVRGLDNGRGVDAGRGIGTAQADEFKAHNHIFHGDDYINTSLPSAWPLVTSDGVGGPNDNSGGGTYRTQADSATPGGTETRPRNVAMMYCIKT